MNVGIVSNKKENRGEGGKNADWRSVLKKEEGAGIVREEGLNWVYSPFDNLLRRGKRGSQSLRVEGARGDCGRGKQKTPSGGFGNGNSPGRVLKRRSWRGRGEKGFAKGGRKKRRESPGLGKESEQGENTELHHDQSRKKRGTL